MPSRSEIVARLRAAGCVFAEDEAALLLGVAHDEDHLESMIARRAAGFPLEHVLGWADFAGARVAVTGGVFVPRHRTELLTTTARALVRPGHTVLDLCCGTGALGLVVVRDVTPVRLVASDVDPAAVECARRNLAPLTGEVFCGDLFAPLPADLRGTVDLLLANVPYVPTAEIAYLPEEFRVHEARSALDGGADGLDILRRLADEAPGWLAPGGTLLTEVGAAQVDPAREILSSAGLRPRTVSDTETFVVVASLP
ncbi:putative protein N(5)-glutamine methyltransferase [Dactylosporangium roseum]|uniref:putative protein N(5)-glutamine methyltransferase n=1 Tax=Dactylosporangium roseum TaxID=47989 RepID=UPI0021B25B23|nr:putative protein N(5)-glutamine methyltransferase [Dactylosporangium roseum]